MTDQEKSTLERVVTGIKTMRKYQKQFFNGNKAAMKMAMHWENQVDNDLANLIITHKLTIVEPKGPPAQGALL